MNEQNFYFIAVLVTLFAVIGFFSYQTAVYNNHIESSSAKVEGLKQQGNKTLVKPFLEEVLVFLSSDRTDEHEFQEDSFDCEYFTRMLIKNASRNGLDAYSVIIKWEDMFLGHNIVGFDTRDAGMVFVEPQSDEVIDISPGSEYLGKIIQEYHVCKE